MPCLNEEETIAICVQKAAKFLRENAIDGEVLVSDNGSIDNSIEIAKANGARVVNATSSGYGSALLTGIREARGEWVIMGDADDSYDFLHIMPFLIKLREGYDLVMGNRFAGGIELGAMPWSHKYIGNPILSFVGRMFFRSNIRDFHCGLRGFCREKILGLNLQTTGMEFASEMIVKAELYNLSITEIPTILKKDGRNRPPHLRSVRDGWRHLKFLLIYSPNWLFLYPGLIFLCLGGLGSLVLLVGQLKIFNIAFSINTLLYFMFFVIFGFNIISMFLIVKLYAYNHNFLPHQKIKWDKKLREDVFIFMGLALTVVGIALSVAALLYWKAKGYGDLVPEEIMRITIPAITTVAIGIQSVFSGFIMSILKVKT